MDLWMDGYVSLRALCILLSDWLIAVLFSLQFMFQQLGVLVSLVKHHAQSYMDDIFKLINVSLVSVNTHGMIATANMLWIMQRYWEVSSPMQSTIIMLIEELAIALGGEFKVVRWRLCTSEYLLVNWGWLFLDLFASNHSTDSESLHARQQSTTCRYTEGET